MDEQTEARLSAMFEDARALCLVRHDYSPEAYISPAARERHIDSDASATLAETRFAMPWNAGYARGLAEGLRQAAAAKSGPGAQGPQRRCPGCGGDAPRALIACDLCWQQVPASMKSRLAVTRQKDPGRSRVVDEIRSWLKLNARKGAP